MDRKPNSCQYSLINYLELTKAIMLELTTMTKSENSAKSKWRTQASQKYFYDHVQRPQEGPFVAQSGKWTFGRGFLYSVSLLTTVGKTLIFFSLLHNDDKMVLYV